MRRSHERGILPKVYAVAARRLRREDARPELVADTALAFCLCRTLLLLRLALAGRQAGRKEGEMKTLHLKIDLTYDDETMHNGDSNIEAKGWFKKDVLLNIV